jgi:hypothetical protein
MEPKMVVPQITALLKPKISGRNHAYQFQVTKDVVLLGGHTVSSITQYSYKSVQKYPLICSMI